MLDKFILEKSALISYNQAELSNLAASSNHLSGIIKNQPDFNDSFVGGSYKRATMVKDVSDVDVYYQYTGNGNSQTALTRLRSCLKTSYPNSDIKQDSPSILVDFERIPFNITPYKKGQSDSISIPADNLIHWKLINFGELEQDIVKLRSKNSKYIDLIKILKLWNFNYKRGLQNYIIEKGVCALFLYNQQASQSITDWVWTFFSNGGFKKDADKFFTLMKNNYSEATLKSEWSKFIDNK